MGNSISETRDALFPGRGGGRRQQARGRHQKGLESTSINFFKKESEREVGEGRERISEKKNLLTNNKRRFQSAQSFLGAKKKSSF